MNTTMWRIASTVALISLAFPLLAAESATWLLHAGAKQYEGTFREGTVSWQDPDNGLKSQIETAKISELTVSAQRHKAGAACGGDNIAKLTLTDGKTITGCMTPYVLNFVSAGLTIPLNRPEKTDFRVIKKK